MDSLKDSRLKINKIDTEMAKLFVERMKVSRDIAEYKKNHGLPVYDASRENELISKNSELIDEIGRAHV